MLYLDVDDLIEILNKLVIDADSFTYGLLINNINPFMVGVKLLMINKDIMERFPLSKIRIE